MEDKVMSWLGEPIASMSRERLEEVFQQLARIHRDSQDETQRQFDVLRAARTAVAMPSPHTR